MGERIIPEFRILRLTFHRYDMIADMESQPQNAEYNAVIIASLINFQ